MNKLSFVVFAATAAIVAASPAFAKEDCEAGFKAHMMAMSIYVEKSTGSDIADAIRKSLDAYTSCKAGDSFSPRGVWDQIIADMKAKTGK